MNQYQLKEKIIVNKELLNDLENKGWQEIEILKNQIANMAQIASNESLIMLLKNLLTSYYIFIGGLENIQELPTSCAVEMQKSEAAPQQSIDFDIDKNSVCISDDTGGAASAVFEPFEYFVDFDEPSGKPLSDEDLYSIV